MVGHFIDCIREDRESPHNLRDAVNAHLACLAIRKSADAKGQKVLIDNDTCTLALA
jgi:predicted dehydrogenase